MLQALFSQDEAPKPAEVPLSGSIVSAGLRVRRDDDFVLLVRPARGIGAGVWSLPMAPVPDHATAEDAAAHVLRAGLRMDPGRLVFAETLTIHHDAYDVVVNVFDAIGWSGEPRYADRDFLDAAWVNPAALAGVDVAPAVSAWLSGAEADVPFDVLPDRLSETLIEARTALFEAYEAIPRAMHERELDAGLAPVDVLARAAAAEAYYRREAEQLLEPGAHSWRAFNADQWEADRRYRARPMDSEVVTRLNHVQTETLRAIPALGQIQLAFNGHGADGSALRVGAALARIADYDREQIELLRKMQGIARNGGGA